MKIAVSSERPGGLDALVATQFGRCPVFTIVEIDENKKIKNTKIIENPGANAGRGAGPLALQTLAGEKVDVILTTNLGPNASQAVMQMGTPVYIYPLNITVKEAIEKYLKNELTSFSIGGGIGEGIPFNQSSFGNNSVIGANNTNDGNPMFNNGLGYGYGRGRRGHGGRGRGYGRGRKNW